MFREKKKAFRAQGPFHKTDIVLAARSVSAFAGTVQSFSNCCAAIVICEQYVG